MNVETLSKSKALHLLTKNFIKEKYINYFMELYPLQNLRTLMENLLIRNWRIFNEYGRD